MPTQDNSNTTRIQFLRTQRSQVLAAQKQKTPVASYQNDGILGTLCIVTKGELGGKKTVGGDCRYQT